MTDKPHISIVSPVYCAESLVHPLVSRIKASVDPITSHFEIILVEDGSPDNSWQKIQENALYDPRVKGIKLSRNFGQHYAITAGLDQAQGEWVIVMDCDLQDRPEEIINLYNKALEGYDVVLARRVNRKDKFSKKLFSAFFIKLLSYLTGVKLDGAIANFGIYNRKVIKGVCSMRESIRVFPVMVRWVGFNTTTINVVHAEREEGSSSYNFTRLMNLALDIMLAYSDKPLRLAVKLGIFISLSSFLFTIYTVIKALLGGFSVSGYASIMSSLWFLSGLIILVLGISGLYIGKIFQGVKQRPIYLVDTATWKIKVPEELPAVSYEPEY
jgi:polyisoprenyl-phosphate glycosyltransferase